MDSKVYQAILQTLCYADIFDYPLREEEVYFFLCHPEPEGRRISEILLRQLTDQNDIKKNIKRANGVIFHKNNFMFLKGRERLINQRLKREKISTQKLLIAKKVTELLRVIPTIKLIGVSGSVAANNASLDDDIDLFIVAAAKTIWLTRLFTTILVESMGKRRRPEDKDVTNKVCLNMFVDENFLTVPTDKQNVYVAHEVCQLKVLYEKNNTYRKFLVANKWVRMYLPNALSRIKNMESGIRVKKNKFMIHNSLFIIPEFFAKFIQIIYMRRHRTSETTSDHYIAFHPKDYTKKVLHSYRRKNILYGAKI